MKISPESAKKRSFSESDLPVVLKKLKLTTDCSKEDDFGTSETTISTTKNSKKQAKKRKSSETDGETSHKILRPTVDDVTDGTITSTTAPHCAQDTENAANETEQRKSPDLEIVFDQVETINIDDDDGDEENLGNVTPAVVGGVKQRTPWIRRLRERNDVIKYFKK